MSEFISICNSVFGLVQTKFTIYGFTLSYWDVFVWFSIASIIIWFIKGVFGIDE